MGGISMFYYVEPTVCFCQEPTNYPLRWYVGRYLPKRVWYEMGGISMFCYAYIEILIGYHSPYILSSIHYGGMLGSINP